MVIEEDELIRNGNSEIIGYEGEWKLICVSVLFGLLIGGLAVHLFTAESEVKEPHMMGSDEFCMEHGYENGYYTSGLSAPVETMLNTTAGIHCFSSKGSHLEDTWETTETADFYLKSDYTIVNKTVEGGTE